MITLENWRSAPHNRWAFHHVRELVPSAEIENDPAAIRLLPSDHQDLAQLRIDPDSGESLSFEQFLQQTDTDAIVILRGGRLIYERYFNGMKPSSPHILMSVSKSLLGLLAGRLAGRGALDVDAHVTRYLPEARGTGFEGASVRQLLDMRTGLDFVEDYLAASGPIVEYRKATGWNALAVGEKPSDLHSFLVTLKSKRQHGGSFDYLSPNSDLLGWVMERSGGARYAELMSELLWRPAGAERSAYVTVDRLGAARAAGGICTTARDLARVGQWMIEQDDPWLRDIETQGDRVAWARGGFVDYFPGLPMSYRSKWYILHGEAPLVFGVGIHGQNLFVDRANGLVIAKFSSQAAPLDAPRMALTMAAISRIRQSLAR
jgi:CubicO group peptidase (beta-lactamase class C family)